MNTPNIKISVIIPCYNVEKYIRPCLDSLIAQTFTEWETVLVDDGATDSTPEICDEYASKDGRFRVIHKKNGGVSSARNAGIKAVTSGEGLIMFADSDDWLDEHALEWNWNAYQETNADGIEFYYGWCVAPNCAQNWYPSPNDMQSELWEGHEQIVCHYYPPIVGFGQEALDAKFRGVINWSTKKLLTMWGMSFKKELLLTSGLLFDEDMKMGEDEKFVLEYLNICRKVIRIPQCCYSYRQTTTSASYSRKINFDQKIHDKIGQADYFANFRKEVTILDLQKCYMGTLVDENLRLLLIAQTWNDYSKYTEFLKHSEVKDALRKVDLSKAPLKYKIPMSMVKHQMSLLLFAGIWTLKHIGLQSFLLKRVQ